MAVESLTDVKSAEADMNQNTVTVTFDDQKQSLDNIIAALGKAGYTVPEFSKAK